MKPSFITIHCSDSKNGGPVTIADITAWHKARGWSTCGYHGVILSDGVFQQGRPDDYQGAHVEKHNEGNLGVCLVGTDKFSQAQFDTLKWYIKSKMAAYAITADKIFCHCEFNTAIAQGKTCPNMSISRLKAWLIDDVQDAISIYLFEHKEGLSNANN